jgi:hypothetical protein
LAVHESGPSTVARHLHGHKEKATGG